MLPSTGLFNDIVCPYYKETNCQRPYCHFRHVKNDNIIEQLNDPGIKEALSSKNYVFALQEPATVDLDIITPQINVNTQNLVYKPTPISKLKTSKHVLLKNEREKAKISQNELPVYIPSSIKDTKLVNSCVKKDIEINPLSSHYIPPLCNGAEKHKETVTYKPSSSKLFHKNDNAYEPHSFATDSKDILEEVLNYKPSCSGSSNRNINKYEPHCTPSHQSKEHKEKSKILVYKPSASDSLHQNSDVYEPSGSSNDTMKYEPSKTTPNKRTSQNILNEISNLSDEKEASISNKKFRVDIDLDSFQKQFDLIDEILLESEDIKDNLITDKKYKETKNSTKNSSDKKNSDIVHREKSSSSKKTNSVHNTHKHKSSSHHTSASAHKSKSKVESSRKKDSGQTKKTSDKKHSKQNQTKHVDSTSPIKKVSDHEKEKKRRKHEINGSSKKPDKRKSASEKEKKSSLNLDTHIDKDDYLFDYIETGLDRPVCSTDLRDPIVMECLRISEEYNNSLEHFKLPVPESQSKAVAEETSIVSNNSSKKRIAHTGAVSLSKAPSKQVKKFTPATAFIERYKKVMEMQRQEEIQECEKRLEQMINPDKSMSDTLPGKGKSFSGISQIKSNFASCLNNRPTLSKPIPSRVAHVPKVAPLPTVSSQTLKKGAIRKAHVPNPNTLKKLDASKILDINGSKIPSNVRLSYLNYITEACLEMHKNDVDSAYKMASEEELLVAKKCMNVKVYKNSCLASILKIRKATKESQNLQTQDRNTTNSAVMRRTSVDVNVRYENMTTSQKYNFMKKWILSDEDLKSNSFPMPTDVKGIARVLNDSKKFVQDDKKIRQCSRCPVQFTVDESGIPLIRDACIYHPKRCYTFRGRSTYGCCGTERGSVGCSSGDHVIDGIQGPEENLRTGFVQTLQKPAGHSANEGIYALDCEMVYTTKGIELARVTVVNDNLKSVYDTFVKPENYILDYATIFSGITEEMLRNVKTNIFHVQAVLLNMFSETTILIGHSLESDLKALKLIHKSVVDTSILFPHKAGPPMKRALKSLASEYLQKIIQESHCGHDSAEDARVSMELVLWKLRDSLKLQ